MWTWVLITVATIMVAVSDGGAVIDLQLQPRQSDAFCQLEQGIAPYILYGGAKGGGKSRLVRDYQIFRRNKYPGTRGLIARRTYGELRANHIEPLFQERPYLFQYWHASDGELRWPNGSITEFKYLERTDDVYRYQGIEYADIDLDECTQHEHRVFQILQTSLRIPPEVVMACPGVQPRFLLTGNPGGVGHGWVKRLFIDRVYDPEQGERAEDYAFIPAKVWDNKLLLDTNPDYMRRLENLPDDLRKAYLDGDWSVFAGQYFKGLRPSKHMVDDFPVPTHWARFRALDWGYDHPTVVCWFTVDPRNGQSYIYRHYKKNRTVSTVMAERVLEMSRDEKILDTVAGHDLWTSIKHDEKRPEDTVEKLLREKGLYLRKAVIDRVPGWQLLREYLYWEEGKRETPRLRIFRSCSEIYDGLARLIHADTGDPEDVKKMDGDDEGDCVRYGVQYLHTLPKPEPDKGQMEALIDKIEKPGVRTAFANISYGSEESGSYDNY